MILQNLFQPYSYHGARKCANCEGLDFCIQKKIVCRLYLQVCIYIIGFAVYAPNKNCLATLKERKKKKSFDTILAFFVRNMLFSSNQCRMHFEKIVCKIPKIFTWSFLLMHAFAFGNYYFLTVIGAACYMCEQGWWNRGCSMQGCANLLLV